MIFAHSSLHRAGERLRLTSWACLILAIAVGVRAATPPPNIVFIYTDDQASWTLGCYGNKQAHTPNLDRLAAQGARLTNSLVATPVCSPARASFFSSRYGSEVGILDFITNPGHKEYTAATGAIGLEARFTTFPNLLARAGYATALIGKWHLGDWTGDSQRRYHPTRHGFDHFMGLTGGGTSTSNPVLEKDGAEKKFEGLTDDILTDEALAYLERPHGKPFFLFVGLRAPHTQYLPVAPEDSAPYRDIDPLIPNPDYPDLNVPAVKQRMREYLSSVSGIDRNTGRILAALDRLKLAGNTVVIFSSDHGYNVGHNGIWHKGNGVWATNAMPAPAPNITGRYRPNLYDHSLRVPAIVRWPGHIKAGTVISETISSLDWYPTLIAMAGASAPKDLIIRGRNALPLLRGDKAVNWDNDFFAEYSMRVYCRTDMRAYRTPQWKLVRDFLNPERDELYNLKDDPDESRNLIREPRSDVRAIVPTLDARIREKMRLHQDPALAQAERSGR